ncbi:MAG: aldo/keto reductase [Bacteroidales bacterium]|jgi:aryl-alcohol dehydrogenase-like predicted oxidoreductase
MKYKQLGKTGVLVSELCLGTMTFGGKGYWKAIGQLPEDEVTQLIKTAIDQGINFFDTANAYSEGLAESLLGKALKNLGISRQMAFIATKVRLRMGEGPNQVGLSKLHIQDSVNDSLQRLGLSHIDMLYIHGVDPITPLEETMRGLEDVVRSGKVRYLGVSNHPAWVVVKANNIAGNLGWSKFVASQNFYSIASRDIEREIVPMALSEGISIMPWSPLAGGFLSGKYTRDIKTAGSSRRDNFDFPPINKEKAFDIIDVMTKIGERYKVSAARVALSWTKDKPGVGSVIIGAKNQEQLLDNLACTRLQLTNDEIKELDTVSALTPEYPGWMVDRQLTGRLPETM